MPGVQVGDDAPDFTLLSNKGLNVTLSKLLDGEHCVIVYFYPKAFTPGCTMQACSFRNNYDTFENAKAIILGISRDTPSVLEDFVQKYKLPFYLLSDPQKEVQKLYGVDGSFYGIIPGRKTFLVGKDGKVIYIHDGLMAAEGHVSACLSFVQKLSNPEANQTDNKAST